MRDGSNLITVVVGRKGSGKSTLTREIAEEYDRVIAVDAMGDYGSEEGFAETHGLEEACRYLVKVADRPRFRVSLRDLTIPEGVTVLRVVWEIPDSLLVMDEISLYASPTSFPDELSRIVLMGRHRSISQVYATVRPALVNRNITSQADLIVAFQTHEQRDVLYLKSVLGEKADALPHLAPFEILVYGDPSRAPLAVLDRLDKQGGEDYGSRGAES